MKAPTIDPCARHGADACVVSCGACTRWWAYRGAVREAEYWRDLYRKERAERVRLETLVGMREAG